MSTIVAIAQRAPAYGDPPATMDRLEAIVGEAARAGAELVVFGETWLGGYPAWLDHCPGVGLWNDGPAKEAYAELVRGSIAVPGPETQRIAALCRDHGVAVVLGANERPETGPGQGTIFNSLLIFEPERGLAIHHRKLVPTHTERLVWGPGDGHGLDSVATGFGRVGGLICWEHWMPLARQALHDAGERIHVALWPSVNEVHRMASRHYAFEGRCFVIAAGSIMRRADFPSALPPTGPAEELVLRGGSCVFGPDGGVVVEPRFDDEVLLLAELDLSRVDAESMTLDVSGHYARPDVFTLQIDRQRRLPKERE